MAKVVQLHKCESVVNQLLYWPVPHFTEEFLTVFRVPDTLVRIRIPGSVPLSVIKVTDEKRRIRIRIQLRILLFFVSGL
jgi:hypothetical protein